MATAREGVTDACFACSGGFQPREKLYTLSCCGQCVHKSCHVEKFGNLLNGGHTGEYMPCPNCQQRFLIKAEVVRKDKFTEAETKIIERVLARHYDKAILLMMRSEVQGIMKALNIRGVESMRYVSYQVFIVGVAFWLPLETKDYCKWEDVASCVSMGFIFENLTEMRGSVQDEVEVRTTQREGSVPPFLRRTVGDELQERRRGQVVP